MAERVDVVVVGAGPAGSSCAYRLAAAGARVVMLDRRAFPRDKPCGGGLTARCLKELPVSPAPVVSAVATAIELRLDFGPAVRHSAGSLLVAMTERRRLDALLAERAAAAGADFRDGVRVRAVEAGPRGVRVVADGLRVEAAMVVGADGVNGVTARSLGLDPSPLHAVAFEGNVSSADFDAERYRGALLLEMGTVLGGYGWIFPKGDHCNVGVGGWPGEGPRLRRHLRRLCAAHGIAFERLQGLRGYRIPVRRLGAPLSTLRGMLVGDAAGVADPLSGDGIFEAALSARLAAEAAWSMLAGRTDSLESYTAELDRLISRHTTASWLAKASFDLAPRAAFAFAAGRLGRRVMLADIEQAGHLPPSGRLEARLHAAVQSATLRGLEAAWPRLAGEG